MMQTLTSRYICGCLILTALSCCTSYPALAQLATGDETNSSGNAAKDEIRQSEDFRLDQTARKNGTAPGASPKQVTTLNQAPTLNQVTTRTIDKELELMQMSTNLKLQTAPLNQWRERRWFAYTFSNQVLTVVGTMINGCTRLQYRHDTGAAPKNLFVNSSWLRILAYAIALAGCAGEAANDVRMQTHEKKLGLDLKSYMKHSRESLAAIDELVRQRAALVDLENDPETKAMLMREGKILSRIRNCCADDLEEAYVRSKAVRAARYFQYAYVGTSNIIGGAGTLANNIATIQDKPSNYLWPGGVGDTFTGPMNAFAPEAIRGATSFARKKAGHPLTAEATFDAREAIVEKFDSDLKNFCALPASQNNQEVSSHIPIYDLQGKILAQHFDMRPVPPKGTVERVVGDFGAFPGGATKCVNGIETLVGAYHYSKDAHRRFENFGAGGITYGIGMGITAEETLRREIISEWKWHKQPKGKRLKNTLKAQLASLAKARENLHVE